MLEQDKVLILNLLKDLTPELEIALGADAIELVSSIEGLGEREAFYVLMDSGKMPEHELLKNARVLNFSGAQDINSFLRNRGDVIFNPRFAKSDAGKLLIERYFSKKSVIQFETAYGEILKNSFSTKFSNPLTVGHYSDIITKFAHSEKADITGPRTFLSSVTSFFTFLAKKKISWFPLDVDYGTTEDALIVQIIAPVKKIYKDYVLQSLDDEDGVNPFVGLMDICLKQSHAVDIYYLEKSNKLVITGVWLKDESLYEKAFYPSLLINNLYTFNELKEKRRINLTSKVSIVSKEMEIDLGAVHGKGVDLKEDAVFEENKNLLSLKRLVVFIKSYREVESNAKPDAELLLRDISIYLRKYPDQNEIKQLEQSDREAILECFLNKGMQEELDNTIEIIKSSVDKEDFLRTVIDGLTELDEDDAINIASNSIEKETSQIIKEAKEEKERNYMVRGAKEEALGNMTVKSLTNSEAINENHNFEDWEGNKKNVTDKVSKRLEEIGKSGENVGLTALQEEVKTLFSEEFGNDKVANSIVKSITDNASEILVNEKVSDLHETKQKIKKEKSEEVIALRNDQLMRMKKVFDTIQNENRNLKTKLFEASGIENEKVSNEKNDFRNKLNELNASQNDLQKVIEKSKVKDIAMTKLRESHASALKNKDDQILQGQKRLESLLESHSKEDAVDISIEMEKILSKNRLLQSQVDLKEKTIVTMLKKVELSHADADSKISFQLKDLKEKNIRNLELVKSFKEGKSEAESKMRLAQRNLKQKETELNIVKSKATMSTNSKESSLELVRALQTQKVENVKVNEINKALSIKVKQFEQKVKFLTAQFDAAGSKSRGGKAGISGGGTKGNEAKIGLKLKQMEIAREKIALDNKRISAQLDTRKKETHTLTTENNLLKNKLAELEMKFSRVDKKAS